MFMKRLKKIKNLKLFLSFVLSLNFLFAQTAFYQDNNFDFRGTHVIRVSGSNLNNFKIFVHSNSDIKKFKLKIKRSDLSLSPHLLANKFRVDMNNDGVWEQNWTATSEKTIIFDYPEPTNGVVQEYQLRLDIKYHNYVGQYVGTETRYHPIKIYATPRVFPDSDGNVFIQLRDEDASQKKPVLLVEGFDPLNENFPERYYTLTESLINNRLYPDNCAVFILNFKDGGGDIRQNAQVLKKCIQKIQQLSPNYRIAVGGLSMGGLVSRYALAEMEEEGQEHNAGLFFSFDSPQDGAHISPEMQDWIKGQNRDEEAIRNLQDNLKSIAAKQMLRYNTYDEYHTFYNNFFNDLNAKNGDGYPHKSYNVAISNGNFDATWGYSSVGRDLMTLKINDNLINSVSAVKLDCGTGSKMTDITGSRYVDIYHNPFLRIYYELNTVFNPVFIPTWSGIDLVNPYVNELTGNIESHNGSKFNDYLVQSTALEHHELSMLSENKVMTWLNRGFNLDVTYELPFTSTTVPEDNYHLKIMEPAPVSVAPVNVTLRGNTVTYNHSHWNDGVVDNPRNFYPKQNEEYTSFMKGSLVTETAKPTGSNSGRRIVKTKNGKTFIVHEDNARVYMSKSDNNGSTWQEDLIISRFGEVCKNPSIAVSSNMVFVTWFNQTIGKIEYREYNATTSTWGAIQNAASISYTNTIIPAPAIAVSEQVAGQFKRYITFHKEKTNSNNGPLGTAEVECYYSANGTSWNSILTPFIGKNPSISHSFAGGGGDVGLVWENGHKIFFKSTNAKHVWSNTVQVSPNVPYIWNQTKPNISYTYGVAHIVWEGMEEDSEAEIEMLTGYYRTYDAVTKSLGALHNMPHHGSEYLHDLTISTDPANMHNYTIFYTSEGEIIRIKKTGNSFGETNFGSGTFANVEDHGQSHSVWTKYNSAPYFIHTHYQPSGGLAKATNAIAENPLVLHKRYGFDFSTEENASFLSLDLKSSNLNSSDIQFNEENNSQLLQFDNLDAVELTWHIFYEKNLAGLDDNVELMRLYLENENEKTLLKIITLNDFKTELNNLVTTRFNYATLNTKSGKIVIDFNENLALQTNLLKTGSQAQAALAKWSRQEGNTGIVPAQYQLHNNYPNPFNPVTHIRFDLPEATDLKLTVYNIQGQEIATLLNGYKEAGSHELVFDATGLASGLYFYRFESQKYNAVKRMLLVK